MNTIINKKGNVGFRVTPWNFNISNGKVITSEEITSLCFRVTKVNIKACGTKQMLIERSAGNENSITYMHCEKVLPSTLLFDTEASAIEYAEELYRGLESKHGLTFSYVTR